MQRVFLTRNPRKTERGKEDGHEEAVGICRASLRLGRLVPTSLPIIPSRMPETGSFNGFPSAVPKPGQGGSSPLPPPCFLIHPSPCGDSRHRYSPLKYTCSLAKPSTHHHHPILRQWLFRLRTKQGSPPTWRLSSPLLVAEFICLR